MMNIDKCAYSSKLKDVNPLYKLTFALLTLGVCLWANSIIVSVLIIFIMGGFTVYKGGIPKSLFIKLMLVPMSFLIVGVLTIGINVSDNQSSFVFSVFVFEKHIGVSRTGIIKALDLFFKSLGAVSCLYYLSLNTPMVDLLAVLRRLKVPKILIELMGLIYRFIFVLLDTADTMITAQNSRLGYSTLKASYRSLAALVSTLFIRAYKRSDDLYTALEARGYDGELNVLEEPFETHCSQYIIPIVLDLFLILVTLFLRRYAGGIV